MTTYTYDHIHLRSQDPMATAQYFNKMFDAKIVESVQSDGQPRIDIDVKTRQQRDEMSVAFERVSRARGHGDGFHGFRAGSIVEVDGKSTLVFDRRAFVELLPRLAIGFSSQYLRGHSGSGW